MADLIDRQAAIDAILHNQGVYSNNFGDDPIDKYTIAIIDNDAQTIAQLPSAQPQRKTGKWEEISKNYYNRISGRCSACGWEAHLYEDDVVGMPYCPNCGAKMEEIE